MKKHLPFQLSTILPFVLMLALVTSCKEDPTQDSLTSTSYVTSQYGNYLAGLHARYERDFDKAAEYYGKTLTTNTSDQQILKAVYTLNAAEGKIGWAKKKR